LRAYSRIIEALYVQFRSAEEYLAGLEGHRFRQQSEADAEEARRRLKESKELLNESLIVGGFLLPTEAVSVLEELQQYREKALKEYNEVGDSYEVAETDAYLLKKYLAEFRAVARKDLAVDDL
jgi:hypothetical protein